MRVFLSWIVVCIGGLGFGAGELRGLAQQPTADSSRREATVIAAIEAAGGKVQQISAADENREMSFYLSSSPIKDEQLKDVGVVQNVIWMNLAGTAITDEGLKYLADMPLQKLHLERTQIGDAGLVHLKTLQDLEYLNLYGTQVTDAGLKHLEGLKKLKKLYVWQTGVTDEGMSKLNETLVDLEIVGEVKLEPVVVEADTDENVDEDAAEKTEPADDSAAKKSGESKAKEKTDAPVDAPAQNLDETEE